MNILLVSDSYPPEIRSAAHLMLELAEELSNRGHEITVVTTYPEYNLDKYSKQAKLHKVTVEKNHIKVVRLKTLPHHNVNYVVRGVSQLLMPIQFILNIVFYRLRADIVIVYSPPLPLSRVGVWLKRFGYVKKFLLNVQDIFPQNAIDLGILKSRLLIKFFQRMEATAYKGADVITLHSDGNRDFLIKAFPAVSQKSFVLHNWVDVSSFDTSLNSNRLNYREKWGLGDKTVFLFAGVMGPSQNLGLIIRIAERLKRRSDVLFLFVGGGAEKEKLIYDASSRGLRNVIFKGFVSRDIYPELLRSVSVGIVSLSPANKTPVVPGKILGYMAAAIPVIAFLNAESDGHKILKKAEAGLSADSNDFHQCLRITEEMIRDKSALDKFGKSGHKYALDHFSKHSCMSDLERLLR